MMNLPISPSQFDVQSAVRSFLLDVMPQGMEIIEGLDNLVPEPQGSDFIVITPIMRERLATNIHFNHDCAFDASINNNQLTVTHMQLGSISLGATLFGIGVSAGTVISRQISGDRGGIGTYELNISQSTPSETTASGVLDYLQKTELTFQCDIHGSNSANNAQVISTLFRDGYCADSFKASGIDIAPLYAEAPRLMPFQNAEQNWEWRWIVELCLEANIIVSPPQQYFTKIDVTLKPVA
jgi:hypothetical protein